MRWKCQKVDSIRWIPDGDSHRSAYTIAGQEYTHDDLPVGAIWHSDQEPLTPSGHLIHLKPTICVMLPGRVIWPMNYPPTSNPQGGWTITGSIPDITAAPSINFVGIYHGYVQNGFVTDDVDGRKFDDLGKKI